MKLAPILLPVAAALSAAVLANSLTFLSAGATVTAGLAMTPARCQAVGQKEHLACYHGSLVRAPRKAYRVHMTLALKKVPYQKPDRAPVHVLQAAP